MGADEVLVDFLTCYTPEFIQKVEAFYKVKHNQSLEQYFSAKYKAQDLEALIYLLNINLNAKSTIQQKIKEATSKDKETMIYFSVLFRDFFADD